MRNAGEDAQWCSILPGVYALVPGADHLCLPFLL